MTEFARGLQLSVRDDFLTPAEVRALAVCCRTRQKRGEFQAARIGRESTLQQRGEIRGDLTCWLQEPLHAAERLLFETVERLRLELNQALLLGLFEAELHYAWYPPGAGYDRHVDQPHGSAQRVVSLIMYLNEGWQAQAGGSLRVFAHDDSYSDIQPLGGRLVCFASAEVEHAVIPAARDRFSISGWLRRRD